MPERRELANALRALAMDAIEQAGSGHPGAPMGMADMAEVLWNDFLKHNPDNPAWWNRDRFVLSNGHASMLLYGLLHLSGYDVTMDDLKNFRQLGSRTPGHPEHGLTPGVEITTGPLGQGFAAAVGMALAEQLLAERYNRENYRIVDHYTYVFLGDGCLMEGISQEAASLAGTWGLGKLIALWDDNGISIDGPVKNWFADSTPERFEACNWHVVEDVDGHDPKEISKAIAKARKVTDKPSLICCRTTIAFGAPTKAGSEKSHGSPLGKEEIDGARKILGWKYAPFEVPSEIRAGWDARLRGEAAEKKWNKLLIDYSKAYPAEYQEFTRRMQGNLPEEFAHDLAALMQEALRLAAKDGKDAKEATRNSSLGFLNALGPRMPELLGGSADLSPSVGVRWKGSTLLTPENLHSATPGNNISYGVREFGMGAIMNGLALHGGFIPYGGTFLIFSDYAKNAIRMAALMRQRVVWVLSHDSIGVGEDGPTHQPVEQLAGLRYIPELHVWRPCDKLETIAAWASALTRRHGPSCLALSRQDLPMLSRAGAVPGQDAINPDKLPNPPDAAKREVVLAGKFLDSACRGGYIIHECKGAPEAIIIATGSEVHLAVAAAESLEEKKVRVRVVSMPCTDMFDAQDAIWKESVLPSSVTTRVAIEAASADFWHKYVGLKGRVIGMNSFGESAPGKTLFEHFGFTVDNVVKTVEALLAAQRDKKP